MLWMFCLQDLTRYIFNKWLKNSLINATFILAVSEWSYFCYIWHVVDIIICHCLLATNTGHCLSDVNKSDVLVVDISWFLDQYVYELWFNLIICCSDNLFCLQTKSGLLFQVTPCISWITLVSPCMPNLTFNPCCVHCSALLWTLSCVVHYDVVACLVKRPTLVTFLCRLLRVQPIISCTVAIQVLQMMSCLTFAWLFSACHGHDMNWVCLHACRWLLS